ncbi:MAG: TolC family protein [Polymorphobacter sp.]
MTYAKAQTRHAARLFATVLLFATTPALARLQLPPPGGAPQAIDFAADPVLRFLDDMAPVEDFRAAIAAAVSRYPTNGEGLALDDAAIASRRAARSALLPQLSLSLVASRSLTRNFEGNSAIVEGLIPRGRTDAAIGADQRLYDFGATSSRIVAASARINEARAMASAEAIDSALGAITAWYALVGAQAFRDLASALADRHRQILVDTISRRDAGLGSGGDVARAEAGLADALGNLGRRDRGLAGAEADYHALFGATPPAAALRPAAPQSAAGGTGTAIAMARAAPAVRAALARAQAAEAEARALRGDARPQVSAGVSATRYNAFDSGNNYDVRGQIMLRQMLSLGGAETARISEARARARALGFAAERVRIEAERAAEAAAADARILAAAARTFADAYRANRRSRDTLAEQFRVSRGSLIDLIRTEQDYVASAEALVRADIERDLAQFTLMARTGELPGFLALPIPETMP